MKITPSNKLTKEDVKRALQNPPNYGTGDKRVGNTLALGPVILTRDSDAIERSNARVLKRTLEALPEFEGQWEITSANHWAVGWVEHISFVAADSTGNPSAIFKWIRGWFDALDEYPIADEFDVEWEEDE